MNKRYFAFLFSIILLFQPIYQVQGQNKKGYSVSGTVKDISTGSNIDFATVAVYSLPDTLLISGAAADSSGHFRIDRIQKGDYLITASFVGYKTSYVNISISNESLALSEPITLEPAVNILDGVMVTAEREEKQSSVERTKINVSKSISSVSGNVTDVLKNHSAISIDADNTLYIRGNKNILILIDGIPTTVSSLNSIPASGVDNIEIITNPDVRYDAEGTGGIINIITKREGISGLSGAASVNYGLLDNVNGGIDLHYSKGIWDFGLNYSGKYNYADVTSSLTREIYPTGVNVVQKIVAGQSNSTQTVGFQMTARPSTKNLFSFGAKYMTPKMNNLQFVDGEQSDLTSRQLHFTRKNDITFNRKVFDGSIGYKRIFEKGSHELSVNAAFSRTRGSRPSEYCIDNELLQKSSGGGTPTNYTIQADYLKSIGNGGKFEAGLKFFSRWNNFDYKFYNLDRETQLWNIDTDFSNNLKHQEYIYSAYLMYSATLFSKLSVKLGARAEYNTAAFTQETSGEKVNKDYFFPFPFLQLDYSINTSNSLALNVNRRITRPTYPQLNPFIYVIDQMTYETGNKNLIPEVLDKVEINYLLKKAMVQLKTSVYYSTTHNFITQVSLFSDSDKLLMTYINGERQQNIGADIDLNFKFSKYFTLNPSVSVYHTTTAGKYNEIDLSTNSFAWNGNIKAVFKPEPKTEIQLLFNYSSPTQLPQFNLDGIYYADAAIKRSFLKNRLTASITLTDIFNTRNWVIHSDNNVYKLDNSSKDKTRILWIGLTYNFNSFKQTSVKKNEERDRKVIKLGAID